MKTQRIELKKVDYLKHLTDHGLNLDLTDKQFSQTLKTIKECDFGSFELVAKQSRLLVKRSGNLTLCTLLLSSHAKRDESAWTIPSSNSVLMRECSISYGTKTVQCGFGNLFFETLESTVFGHKLPYAFDKPSGHQLDKIKSWLDKGGAFALLGESGARAFFESLNLKTLEGELNYSEVNYTSRTIAELQANTDLANAKANQIKIDDNIKAAQERHYSETLRLAGAERLEQMPEWIGEHISGLMWGNTLPITKAPLGVRGQREQWSHPLIRPNYTLTVQGENVFCSSNIKIPFAWSQLKEAEKHRFVGLKTPYGFVSILEGRDENSCAKALLRVGCHILDPSQIGLYLNPTHTVTLKEATPDLLWGQDSQAIINKAYESISTKYKATRERLISEKKRVRKIIFNAESEIASGARAHKIEELKTKLDCLARAAAEKLALIEQKRKWLDMVKTVAIGLLKIQSFNA